MGPHQKRRFKFLSAGLLSISLGVTLLLVSLKDNLMYFHKPSELRPLKAFYHKKIRLGGLVKTGSLHHDAHTLKTSFVVFDDVQAQDIPVSYSGVLPDLFREGQGIVAEGALNEQGIFSAHRLLAKHDETYRPPQSLPPSETVKPLRSLKPVSSTSVKRP